MIFIKSFVFNPLRENTYLVGDDESKMAVLIDPGCSNPLEKEKLFHYIADNQWKIQEILCTHLHFDHIVGVPFVQSAFQVGLAASPEDSGWIGKLPQMADMFGMDKPDSPVTISQALAGGHSMEYGKIHIEVLQVPGHSRGGLAFYLPDEKILFSGDSLFSGSIGRTDLDGGCYADLMDSLHRTIMILPDDTKVLCGHGADTLIGFEREHNPYIA